MLVFGATVKVQPSGRGFYWMAKCSCVLGMSLKLEVVLGESHKPTRAIPGVIYLYSTSAEVKCSLSKERIYRTKTWFSFLKVWLLLPKLFTEQILRLRLSIKLSFKNRNV